MVELLVVLALIGILAAIAVPALEPMMRGSKLTTASDDLRYALSASRQRAVAENRAIQFRFLGFRDPATGALHYNGYVSGYYEVVLNNDKEEFQFKTVDKSIKLPEGVVFTARESMSSFFGNSSLAKGQHEVTFDNQTPEFTGFSFLPDGSTDLPKRAGDLWYASLVLETDEQNAQSIPNNFVCLQIDAFTGDVKTFQPGT